MKDLVKDGDIILDGTAPRYEKEMEAFIFLGKVQQLLKFYNIETLEDLENEIKLARNATEKIEAANEELDSAKKTIQKFLEPLLKEKIDSEVVEDICKGKFIPEVKIYESNFLDPLSYKIAYVFNLRKKAI